MKPTDHLAAEPSPTPSGSMAELETLLLFQQPVLFNPVFLQITRDFVTAWVLNEVFYWTIERVGAETRRLHRQAVAAQGGVK
jgi:hypothetical protein